MTRLLVKFLCFVSLAFGAAQAHATTWKVMVDKTFIDACIPTADVDIKRTANALTPIGVVTGDCADTWASGVNFSNGWRAVRLGRTNRTCDSEVNLQTTTGLPNGRSGMMDTWNCAPAGATANPCLHTDGKTYLKCEAVTP